MGFAESLLAYCAMVAARASALGCPSCVPQWYLTSWIGTWLPIPLLFSFEIVARPHKKWGFKPHLANDRLAQSIGITFRANA